MSAISIKFDGPATLKDVKKKIAAFHALTGTQPDVWVCGYFDTIDGGEVCARYAPVRVKKIMRTRMIVVVDGTDTVVSGEIDSFRLSNL